jgi:glycerol uptake facilitator-like aquaporin
MKFHLPARLTAEFLGSAFLVAAVIGSGIMGERLAGGNVAIALLANTIATGAALVALILTFGPISGAHLNPAVTLAEAIERGIPWSECGGLHACAMRGRSCRSDRRASDVRAALVFLLLAPPTRVGVWF